ncbi:MAG TPA: DUF4386 domain-containing protein [Candidatus Solibacter sp.]|nr:DUF4386 domain-containing protein [Candidatus Solibacter sp.]
MRSVIEQAETQSSQRGYARLAGFLFLIEIVLALGGGFLLSHIAGSGTFTETAKRIAASEHLYRAALSMVVIVTLCSAVLAFALYATLRPVNRLLAQLAMIFSLGDSFLAMVVRTCGFVRVHLYISAQNAGDGAKAGEALSDLIGIVASTAENIGGISFGIGTLLFFYLFFKSNYIPRVLSVLGLAASAIWTCVYFANLVFPEQHSLFMRICLPPLALADITTGFYLMLFAVRAGASGNQDTQRASVGAT